jgi:hypothetical protein
VFPSHGFKNWRRLISFYSLIGVCSYKEKDLVSQRACLRWDDAGGFEERKFSYLGLSYLLNEDY